MLIDSPLQDAILVTPPLGSGDDVYISYDRDGRITNLGKHIGSEADNLCALVGISKYSPEFLYKLFAKAQRDFAADRKNDHYEECVFATSQMGHPVYILPCEDLRWIEVDTERDLEKARQLILEIFDRTEQSME
jgi:choline kinase